MKANNNASAGYILAVAFESSAILTTLASSFFYLQHRLTREQPLLRLIYGHDIILHTEFKI